MSPEEASAKAYEEPGSPEEISRRRFLANATIVMGNIVALGVAIPSITSLIPTAKVIRGSKGWWPLDKGEMAQLQRSTDKPIKIFFRRHISDGYIEGDPKDYVYGVKLNAQDEQKMRSERPDLFQDKAGQVPYPVVNMGFVMFSPVCPHLGCHYDWNDAAGKFICPCHGSVYTKLGKHVAGPAPRGLDPLPLREHSGVAEITWIRFKSAEAARLIVSYS
jgi:menaquinol-cytochrome c reductase iron-sulfur subunit